jgi:putative addiction module component (TIGR02574 family)
MSPTANQILESFLTLPLDERAELAALLWDSVDEPADEGLVDVWEAEIRRRIESTDRGDVQLISHEEVKHRLGPKYGKTSD